jgi:hypothetical protein
MKTALIHAAFALAFQLIVGLSTGNWWAGAAGGALFYLGREHAQREYKLTAGASVKGLRPWDGMDIANWSTDAKLDLAVPVAAVLAVAVYVEYAL